MCDIGCVLIGCGLRSVDVGVSWMGVIWVVF